jgi:hypothetical protein
VSEFFWQCPSTLVSGGLFTKLLMLVIGVLLLSGSIMPGLKMRAAFSRQEGAPATRAFRGILLLIGGLLTVEAIRLLSCA